MQNPGEMGVDDDYITRVELVGVDDDADGADDLLVVY